MPTPPPVERASRDARALHLALRLGALLVLVNVLSSCIATGIVITGYYGVSGGLDHDARVAAAWVGPGGELALELEELEGVCRREKAVLVLTADELEQAFAGVAASTPPLIPVPHVRLPRAVVFREIELSRPPPGSAACVRAEPWDAGPVESGGTRRYVLPEPRTEELYAVHWTHGYRTGAADETGFVLLLTRATANGVQHALLLPEAFDAPAWTGALVWLALATDVLWITLLLL